jgi:precorrin-6A synthase
MLDGNCSFNSLNRSDFYIWWGAYLGMKDQIIFSGNLDDVADLIVKERKKARDKHGWIMDTYLIKKR